MEGRNPVFVTIVVFLSLLTLLMYLSISFYEPVVFPNATSSNDHSLGQNDSNLNSTKPDSDTSRWHEADVEVPPQRDVNKTIPTPVKWTPSKTHPSLSKRATKGFADCVATGGCFLKKLDEVVPPSIFTAFSQLTDSGWQLEEMDMDPDSEFDPRNHLSATFQALNWEKSDFQLFSYRYPQPWIRLANGAPAMGFYEIFVNPKAGVILIVLQFSPQQPVVPPPTYTPTATITFTSASSSTSMPAPNQPPVTRFSDFAYLCLLKACNNDEKCVKNIQWWLVDHVTNEVSNKMLRRVLRHAGYAAPSPRPWPGQAFDVNTADGKALVGTPNGYGLLWMLGQHQLSVGAKTVDKAYVFANGLAQPCFAFHVVENVNMPVVPGHPANWEKEGFITANLSAHTLDFVTPG